MANAVRFFEYWAHGHVPAVTDEVVFDTLEVRGTEVMPGRRATWKTTAAGQPRKAIKAGGFATISITFKVIEDTLKGLANLLTLADDSGRVWCQPHLQANEDAWYPVVIPSEVIQRVTGSAGYYVRGTELTLDFKEAERDFPLRQTLFRATDWNNIWMPASGDVPLKVTYNPGTGWLKLNRLPNIKSLFEPTVGKEWMLVKIDSITPSSADPSTSGDYAKYLQIGEQSTYTLREMMRNKTLWVSAAKGAITDFAVDDEVALINPFESWNDMGVLANGPIIEEDSGVSWRSDYVSPGGVFKHTMSGDWIVLVNGKGPAVQTVGAFRGADLGSMAALNSDTAVFPASVGTWRDTQILATGSVLPYGDEPGWFIAFCMGYDTSKWKIGHVIFDEDFTDISYSSAEVIDSSGSTGGFGGAGVCLYAGKYWMTYVDRDDDASDPDSASNGWALRWATCDTVDGTFVDAGMIAEGLVSVDDLDGYWRSRCVDMATPFIWRNQLYCLAGGTSNRMRSATRGNRVYGFFKWDERTQAWIEDTRNPLIMNPLANIWHATDYDWCSDHMGGYPCFWADEQERYLYLFTSYTDASDGYVVGYTFWDLLDVGLFG